MKYTCPCCGYKTLNESGSGTFEICELCNWENDSVQSCEPDYEGGPNGVSLREAQHVFLKEASNTQEFIKDPNWNLLGAPSIETRLRHSKINFIINRDGEANKS